MTTPPYAKAATDPELFRRPPGTKIDVMGVYCRHTFRVVENDPKCYPVGLIVDPWPCSMGCRPEQFKCNWEERWSQVYDELLGPATPKGGI